MVPNKYDNSNVIVKSWPGSGTANTYYQTADGSVWYSQAGMQPRPSSGTMPNRVGYVENGRIVTR